MNGTKCQPQTSNNPTTVLRSEIPTPRGGCRMDILQPPQGKFEANWPL